LLIHLFARNSNSQERREQDGANCSFLFLFFFLAACQKRKIMAVGINYAKWDSLDVSGSEDEEDDGEFSKAALIQQHRELTEASEAQQKLRKHIADLDEAHRGGKQLEPPEELRDILEEPFWCDAEGNIGGNQDVQRNSASTEHQNGKGQQRAATKGAGSDDPAEPISSKPSCPDDAAPSIVNLAPGKRRDYSEWDKLKLEDDSEEVGGKVEQKKTPAEVEKLRQLIQLQEGLNKMRKDREESQKKVQLLEKRMLERDGNSGMSQKE